MKIKKILNNNAVITLNDRKEEVIAMLKKAIEHKKEWQKRFEDTYASPGMKVEFF